jgi:PAS domain S-box-containing protein
MDEKTIRILLIEDNPDDAELIRRRLARSGNAQFTVIPTARLQEGLECLARDGADLVLSDLGLPDSHGLDTISKILCEAPHIPVVVLSGFDDEDIAIQAVHLGAQDYLVKGQLEGTQLELSLFYAIERSRLQRELEQYAQEISKVQANLCKILDKNADAIIVISKDRNILFANPAAEHLLGHKKKELLNKPFDFPLKGRGTSEINIPHKGGGKNVAEMRVVDIDWEGEPAYLASLRDITERRQTEEALAESEKFSTSLLENSPNPIEVINPDTSIRYVNPAFVKLTGFTLTEIIGKKSPYPWWPEEQREEIGAALKKDMTTSNTRTERISQKKNGELFWAVLHIVPVTHKGELRYFLINWVDITERKRAEEEIKRAAQEWRITFDSINDWVSIHDRDFNFIRVNKSLADAFKKKPGEIIGQTCYQLLHGSGTPIPDCPHVKALKSKKPAKGEVRLDNPDIYVEISVSPILDDNGEAIGTVHITKDITERKEAEEKLRQIDQMKSEFLSNVSHELRTPLQSIGGFAKLILNGKVPDAETQHEFLEIIDRESQHLGNLINSLLDMSRLESGRFQINKRLLPVRDIIIDVIKSFRSLARDKDITLNEDVQVELPEIEADGDRLTQVVMNLLSNAIKYSDPGGSVTVKAESQNGELLFQVTDHGIGIPEESMAHLFERFYRAEDKLARGGTGLGLYISKQIIEAHGGNIWAASRTGEGSTFSFTLPLNGKGDDHG